MTKGEMDFERNVFTLPCCNGEHFFVHLALFYFLGTYYSLHKAAVPDWFC